MCRSDSCGNSLADTGLMRSGNSRRVSQEFAVEIAQVGYGEEEGFLLWGEDRGWGRVVGGEEWGGVAGEGEEYFVEHFGSALPSVNTKFRNTLEYRLCGRFLSCPKLIEQVLS